MESSNRSISSVVSDDYKNQQKNRNNRELNLSRAKFTEIESSDDAVFGTVKVCRSILPSKVPVQKACDHQTQEFLQPIDFEQFLASFRLQLLSMPYCIYLLLLRSMAQD